MHTVKVRKAQSAYKDSSRFCGPAGVNGGDGRLVAPALLGQRARSFASREGLSFQSVPARSVSVIPSFLFCALG